MSVIDPPQSVTPPPSPSPERDRSRYVLWLVLGLIGIFLLGALLAVALVLISTSEGDIQSEASESASPAPTTETQPTATQPTATQPTASTADPTAATTASSQPATTATTDRGGPVGRDGCSAAELTPAPAPADLPTAVAAKRAAILSAASACDLEELVALTGPAFIASFGDSDPLTLWTGQEADGAEPIRYLVELLSLPYSTTEAEGDVVYVWPSAHSFDDWQSVPTADRQALESLYSAAELAEFDRFGGYLGYRIGIDQDGNWLYFVAGD